MYNEYIWKIAIFSLFQILSAMFVPNIIWIGLHLGKLWPKLKGKFFWDIV